MNLDWSYPGTSTWDDSQWVVALPSDFTFRYWGETFSHLSIGGNGGVKGLTTASPSKTSTYGVYYRSYAFGHNNAYVKNMIAPWWTDWARSSESPHPGGIYYEIEGEAPNRVLKIEWRNVQHFACGTSNNYPTSTTYIINDCANQRSYSFQVWLVEAPADDDTANSTIIFSYAMPIGPPPLNEPMGGIPTAYNYGSSYYEEAAVVGVHHPETYGSFVVPPAFHACGVKPNSSHYGYYGDCRVEHDWPAEQGIVFTNEAELIVGRVDVEPTVWGGYHTSFSAVVRNVGAAPTVPTKVQFFGSTDRVLSDDDDDLGIATLEAPIAAGQEVVFHHQGNLPAHIEPGTDYYILAKVDPEGVVDEAVRLNNVTPSPAMRVGPLTPDLIVESVDVPTAVVIGETFDLPWTVRNLGNLGVEEVPYVVVLSDNEVVTPSDLTLGSGTLTVGPLTTADLVAQVTLPEEVLAGDLYLGVIIDPGQDLHELNKFNNTGASEETLNAQSKGLAFAFTALPPAEVGSPYSAVLRATGGNGTYTWSVASGALPQGLELVEKTVGDQVVATEIVGTPSVAGTAHVGLRVESGNLYMNENFVIEVRSPGQELTVTSVHLPEAAVMRDYDGTLAAIGGQPPYHWEVVSGTLPPGVGLGADGKFWGLPTEEGVFAFTVQVEDAGGDSRQAPLEVVVLPADSLRCTDKAMPSLKLDQEFEFSLRASGGQGPYQWTTVESRRIATALDTGDNWVGGEPPGFTLAEDGRIRSVPKQLQAGSYSWQVEVRGSEGVDRARCVLTFEVGYDKGLTIGTTTLAPAVAGERYSVELRATGGEDPLRWSLAPGSELPAGFELATDGTLSGAFDAGDLHGEASLATSFTVRVHDFRNRITEAPLQLTLLRDKPVWEDPEVGDPVTEGGCQSGSGPAGLLAALAVIGLAAFRRRD